MLQNLLLYFSYVGTNYRGMQRLITRAEKAVDLQSVQGIIELGLQKYLGLQESPSINICSRTDYGVHAIESAVQYKNNETDKIICPERLCQGLNFFLELNQTDIRIRRVVQVPEDFKIRSNIGSRTYVYRIAVPRYNYHHICHNQKTISSSIPTTYLNRVGIVTPPFEPTPVLNACKVFLGTWNFRTFSKRSDRNHRLEEEEEDFHKTILSISLTHVNRQIDEEHRSDYHLDPLMKDIDLYDFHIQGSGFVRRQVRRMVGALIGIGRGDITENDIKYMLENPSTQNWNSKCTGAPASGLYLKSINFQNFEVLRGPLF